MSEPRFTSPAVPQGAETYSSAMADAKNYISWILDSFSGYLAAPVLEIGVGHGSYASVLRECGDYIGVDIDPASVEEARQRFPGLDFRTVDITSPEFVALASERKVKTIVCLNVIEHIDDDAKAVTNLARALQPGGHLLIIVPALELLYNDLDRLAGHHRRYSRDQMRSRLAEAGLDIVRCDYFNAIGGLGWLANRALRHGSLNDKAVNSQITLFDKWLVPLSRMADPATRKFFGQSVIAVGRKP
jgi:SAM-dependent methyltransferase